MADRGELVALPEDAEGGVPGFPREEIEAARRYRDASRAESTRRKFARDGVEFALWPGKSGSPAGAALAASAFSGSEP